ncbi:GreA/GreB family elongation factor [Dyella jejuensis]|uniref:GreA/GreB family elongation factor n=1 Tax=Dyella jejuensis TaxID=1432009 RepID=A0ABW8JHM6_9GAMM
MNRAFVNEHDGDAEHALPAWPSDHPNYVTPHGMQQLRERLAAMQAQHDELATGEESDAPARQSARATLERELHYLNARAASAIEVDLSKQPRDRVAFGAIVTVDGGEGEQRWQIVGEDEADAEHGRVSYVSPLASALIGARVGDEVRWQRPAGDMTIEVVRIEYGNGAHR